MENNIELQRETLLFRRQFVLAPRELERFASWQTVKVGSSLHLYAHQDLELMQLSRDGLELTLVGYLIDPENADSTNHDIVSSLLSALKTPNDVFKLTFRLGGRYILIVHSNETTLLLNDACGLRQVYYAQLGSGQNWCASQPALMAEELGFAIDEETEREFVNSIYFRHDEERWWPGVGSPYKEIQKLLPNHSLDLRNGKTSRFWPWEGVGSLSLEEGITRGAAIIQKLIHAASKRFKLALPLTAGVDSRIILAATKDIRDKVYYYTLKLPGLTHSSKDLKVPPRLLTKLGLPHSLIDCSSVVDRDFLEIFLRSAGSTVNSVAGHMAYGLYQHYPQGRVSLSGHCSEIARCAYHSYADPVPLNAETITELAEMHENPYALKQFSKWFDEAKPVADRHGYHVLDMFYWEQRVGRWTSSGQLQLDMIHERFSVFNCRELITTLLAVDVLFRRPPYVLHKHIIERLWKDVLLEPLNPGTLRESLDISWRSLLVRTKTYVFLRDIFYKIRGKRRYR